MSRPMCYRRFLGTIRRVARSPPCRRFVPVIKHDEERLRSPARSPVGLGPLCLASQGQQRQVARQCCVSDPFVLKLRDTLTANVSSDARTYITSTAPPPPWTPPTSAASRRRGRMRAASRAREVRRGPAKGGGIEGEIGRGRDRFECPDFRSDQARGDGGCGSLPHPI